MKDIRGKAPKAGDVVAVGYKRGSSGAELSVRRIVEVKGHDVWMQNVTGGWYGMAKTGKPFKFTASGGFLILPPEYEDAIPKTP